MALLRNPPPSEWPKIWNIAFQFPAGPKSTTGKPEWKSFHVGVTRGPDGNDSVVHSVRPQIVGKKLSFYVYFAIPSEGEERLWEIISGFPYRVKFDVRNRNGEVFSWD